MTELTDNELKNIKALENTELCVCHLQNDCPTHPKGDFGAMTKLSDLEINKICAGVVGVECWHEYGELIGKSDRRGIHFCGQCEETHTVRMNPDYLNSPADYTRFFFFVVNEWDRWKEFVVHYLGCDDYLRAYAYPLCCLFKDQRTLPTAIAIYLKENKQEDL